MSPLRRPIRQTLTIARRDFKATVFTPIFLLFLFAPVLMASFGAIGGMGAASVSQGSTDKVRLVAMLPIATAPALHGADAQLRGLFGTDASPPVLALRPPAADPQRAARAALTARDADVTAILYGSLDRPVIAYGAGGRQDARYLAAVARQAALFERAGSIPPAARLERVVTDAPSRSGRDAAAFFAVFGIFFLTLFLSGQVVGTMAEERNNKVIEILAAAVPLESVFLGKLLGMYGVAVLFVTFWAVVLSQVEMLLPGDMGGALEQLRPAIGVVPFALLFATYFTTAFLLLGSVFLGVGAQASTMREVQMLSLPITIVQVAMFGLASSAVSHPGSWLATAATIFPLSSPFAMAGRAAADTALWPHAAALAWQLLWVAIFITVGARLFRRGVLQSGNAKPAWRRLLARR
ncbi:ABC-2 type transport system permease protein [Sphingomonas sp. BE138]|uniref:ABC transporter permease n=1 Tax=Sphingomonas sp. BE138 TaxID=2817845 RepID=UPI0028581CD6|nr:ABC transporter permease [Sphingomonas sp. BE138]MDR6787006.1 ABC-2 type transport system permease protein [Sphingomonas sp. BE138]